jgi:diacylglycerol kinase family enzyme
MRHLFVINPHSFRTLASLKQVLMDMENCFSVGRRMEYKIYISRRPRDGVSAVRRYLLTVPPEEIVRIYAVGGDGILFDCLNGMVNFPNTELTSVPYGNANDFVRAFGEDAAPAFRDIKKLSAAPSRSVDIIHYGNNYALNEANIGIVGLTMTHANAILRRPTSKLPRFVTPHIYSLSGLKATFNKEVLRQHYTVRVDGQDVSGIYANIHIANGPCNGGTAVPSPYATPNDGRLDIIFTRIKTSLEAVSAMLDMQAGRFEKRDKLFSYKQCRTIEVYSELPLCVELDGEAFYAHEIKMKIIPAGIKFFAPENIGFADFSHKAYRKKGETHNYGQ